MKPQSETQEALGKQMHRVVTFLDRNQVDYLDKLGKDALFSTGVKFPRTRIISAMINLLKRVDLGGQGLRTDHDLEERLLQRLGSGSSEARRLANELAEETHANPSRVRG